MSQPAELGELAVDLDRVRETVERARTYVYGHDQAEGAHALADQPRPSALRTALEHAATALERVIGRLEAMSDNPPADGPPIFRDQGPI